MPDLINQYWPIYKRLEKNIDDLTHAIHICDEQLDVYSSQISDLILRIGAEIEAISKAIYRRDIDPNMPDKAKFDDVAIKRFVQEWRLDQKIAYLSHPNCFCTNREHKPFRKDTPRTGSQGKTFKWNNAYQNLKHNREKAFGHASVGALLSAMAALYILNLYYRNEVVELEDDHLAARVDPGLGSEMFSVQFSAAKRYDRNHVRLPKEDFITSVYFVDQEAEYAEELKAAVQSYFEAYNREVLNSPEAQEALRNYTPDKKVNKNWLRDAIPVETYIACAQRAQRIAPVPKMNPKYQAFINRHQVLDEMKK